MLAKFAKNAASAPEVFWLYAVADTLALERQQEFKWDWIVLFGLGFAAFFCFAMFTHAGYVYVPFLLAYLAIFAAFLVAGLGYALRLFSLYVASKAQ